MKKTTNLLCLIFIINIGIKAQTYLDKTSIWTEYSGSYKVGCSESWEYYQYSITGDTVFNDTIYKKIQKIGIDSSMNWCNPADSFSFPNKVTFINYYRAAIREKDGKFYMRINDSEILLYDFTLQKGDTIKDNSCGVPCIITKIDTVFLGKIPRKRFILNYDTLFYYIEGIGHNFGLFTSTPCCMMQKKSATTSQGLICYKQGSNILYNRNSTECFLITNIKYINLNSIEINIFPNPSKDLINLSIPLNNFKISIIDITGKTMYSKVYNNNRIILDISNLSQGIYFINISDSSCSITKKIIKK